MFLGVWGDNPVGVGDALLIALVAIAIVFATLLIVIFTTALFQKGIDLVEEKTSLLPREENKLLLTDPDAVIAVLVATIDFHKETGKDARVLSIQRIEE